MIDGGTGTPPSHPRRYAVSINSHCFSLGVLVMKKSLLLIKALIIVLWSAQVSLAQEEVTSSTNDIYEYFLAFLLLLPLILQELIILFLASVLSILITFPLWMILLRYEVKNKLSLKHFLWLLCCWPVCVISIILLVYFTYKINVWWFDLYWFENWAKFCLRTGNCS